MNTPLPQTNVKDIYMYLYFKKIRVISITIITLLSLHLLAKVIYSAGLFSNGESDIVKTIRRIHSDLL